MALTIEEIPTLIFWLVLLGATSVVTVYVAGKVGDQITAVLK